MVSGPRSLPWSLVPGLFWGVPQSCHWFYTKSCPRSCLGSTPCPVTGSAQSPVLPRAYPLSWPGAGGTQPRTGVALLEIGQGYPLAPHRTRMVMRRRQYASCVLTHEDFLVTHVLTVHLRLNPSRGKQLNCEMKYA